MLVEIITIGSVTFNHTINLKTFQRWRSMKQTEFLKTNSLPLTDNFSRKFLSFAPTDSHCIENPRDIDVSVLNLEGTSVENPSGDLYRFPGLKIVCFGTCGKRVMNRLVSDYKNGISNVASDEELIPYVLGRIGHYTIPIHKNESGRMIPPAKDQAVVGFLADVIQCDPAKFDTVMFVGSLECIRSIDLLIKSAESARNVGVHAIGIIADPRNSGNIETERGRDALLSKLENALDCLILSSDFRPATEFTVAELREPVGTVCFIMTKAVNTIVDHFIASRNEFSGAAFTLSQLKTLALQGRTQFGFYTFRKTQNLIEIAQNAIVRDFDISKLKTGLLLIYTDEGFSWQVIDYIAKTIFGHDREDANFAYIWTSVPCKAGEIDISLLINN